MKVLSIKEPYASLIKEQIKLIETRSFKTNYRGQLYIHASKSKVLNDEKTKQVLKLLKNKDFNYGYIIAKCQLIDCVYMDEEFIKKIKKNPNEYLCGEYKVGRYAWILKDIEPIDEIIKAKGRLNIWNYEQIQD